MLLTFFTGSQGDDPLIELRLPDASQGLVISYLRGQSGGSSQPINTGLFQLPHDWDVWKWQGWSGSSPYLQMSLNADNSLELVNTAGESKIVLKPGTSDIAPEITINGDRVLTQGAADVLYLTPASADTRYLNGGYLNTLTTLTTTVSVEGPVGSKGGNVTLRAGNGVGSNAAGGTLYLSTGMATGSGGGNIVFQTPGIGATATAPAPMITRMVLNGNGSIAIGTGAQASTVETVAIGEHATASEWEGVALGKNTTASGATALALGAYNVAAAKNAVSVGVGSTASATDSFAAGTLNIAQGQGQAVLGRFNAPVGNPNDKDDPQSEVLVVGAGTQDYTTFQITRKNVLTVKRNGDTQVSGDLKVNGVIRVEPAGDIDMGEFAGVPQP